MGLCAVEEYCLDIASGYQQFHWLVDGIADAGVGSAFDVAVLQHIPESQSAFPQEQPLFRDGDRCLPAHQPGHQRPEPVAGMAVVEAAFKRERGGIAPQNQHPGIGGTTGREGVGAHGSQPFVFSYRIPYFFPLAKRTGENGKIPVMDFGIAV